MKPSSTRLEMTADSSRIAGGTGADLFSKVPAPTSFLTSGNFHYVLTSSDINFIGAAIFSQHF